MPLKLKLDAEGHVVVKDGKPVYETEDGKEVAYDAEYSNATITRLNQENKDWRQKAQEHETKLKEFEAIEDPTKALEAMQTVANLQSGELKTAQQVQEIKDQAKKAAEDQVREAAKASDVTIKSLTAERDTLQTALHGEKVGNRFNSSKYITDKVNIPADLLQDKFGKNFKVEEGKVVGYGVDGQKIYSRTRPGDLADFDEAIEIIIDSYPHKEAILKGTNNSGAGTEHSNTSDKGKSLRGDMGGDRKDRVEAIKSRFPGLE